MHIQNDTKMGPLATTVTKIPNSSCSRRSGICYWWLYYHALIVKEFRHIAAVTSCIATVFIIQSYLPGGTHIYPYLTQQLKQHLNQFFCGAQTTSKHM